MTNLESVLQTASILSGSHYSIPERCIVHRGQQITVVRVPGLSRTLVKCCTPIISARITAEQDVYRRLAEPCAQNALLRLRTSPEFRVVRAYGHLFPDDRFDNLCHVIAADPSTAFAFDFDFTNASGFSSDRGSPPVLQMAFQYSIAVPAAKEESSAPEPDGHAKKHAAPR